MLQFSIYGILLDWELNQALCREPPNNKGLAVVTSDLVPNSKFLQYVQHFLSMGSGKRKSGSLGDGGTEGVLIADYCASKVLHALCKQPTVMSQSS